MSQSSPSKASQPLVEGDVDHHKRYKNGLRTDEPFPGALFSATTNPPDVQPNTRIVAIVTTPTEKASPEKEGWFLSDFYAFNYLLKGLGHSQVWFSLIKTDHLLNPHQDVDYYLHGNPDKECKIVLSKDLLSKDSFSPITLVYRQSIKEKFLAEVRAKSAEAAKENARLLLMMFGHGLDNLIFHMDPSCPEDGLTIAELKGAIDPNCQANLFSTACHFGAWISTQISSPPRGTAEIPMDVTGQTGNDGSPNTMKGLAWSQQASDSVSRYCGSIFTGSIIHALTNESSPFNSSNSANTMNPMISIPSLQPEPPTAAQVKAYDAFCHSIVEISENLSRPHQIKDFTFSAQHDRWETSWPERTGFPLARLGQRWSQLPTWSPNPVPPNSPNTTAPPRTSAFPRPFMQRNASTNEMKDFHYNIRCMIEHALPVIASLWLRTCPGDWEGGYGHYVRSLLDDAVDGKKPHRGEPYNTVDLLAYRWQLASMADLIVADFSLTPPNGQQCLEVNIVKWQLEARTNTATDKYSIFKYASSKFGELDFEPRPLPEQGPRFGRFTWYIAAAIAEGQPSKNETDYPINVINRFVKSSTEKQGQKVLEMAKKTSHGSAWMQSLGKWAHSLSPTKENTGDPGPARPRTDSSPTKELGSLSIEDQGQPGASLSPSKGKERERDNEETVCN
ncbi:hypothetical protein B0I35DRAFT_513260 [Stachybotrys elegans]|uniref:Uncharacterized protein n=1 Tax=Stachybotrys elegans TaxID=80388 RepID=A0A8K0SS71_9HYPO|nr:hypothetical protein B0I35DRAFT_513260 [Stachybotrys elegans]